MSGIYVRQVLLAAELASQKMAGRYKPLKDSNTDDELIVVESSDEEPLKVESSDEEPESAMQSDEPRNDMEPPQKKAQK